MSKINKCTQLLEPSYICRAEKVKSCEYYESENQKCTFRYMGYCFNGKAINDVIRRLRIL